MNKSGLMKQNTCWPFRKFWSRAKQRMRSEVSEFRRLHADIRLLDSNIRIYGYTCAQPFTITGGHGSLNRLMFYIYEYTY